MSNNDILKKRILYRATHRGTKEMDLLLGGFIKKYVNVFSKTDLLDFENLMSIDDEILNNWYFNKNDKYLIPDTKVSKMLKSFKF